ncbi:hypothetical protein AVEN_109633-1 [Araneus ventricosus]|uniref:Uncharacterized protein n=1 Tax=Araneus ventricosus TaxID=182803 RepID=A0A4Y2FQJ9_ARAVE|nr:hypothetical protein AVEN_109633-1 [Araneus ventricosus]
MHTRLFSLYYGAQQKACNVVCVCIQEGRSQNIPAGFCLLSTRKTPVMLSAAKLKSRLKATAGPRNFEKLSDNGDISLSELPGPRWPSGKVSTAGTKGSRLETQFQGIFAVYVALVRAKSDVLVKPPPPGVVRKFREEECQLRCRSRHLSSAQNYEMRPRIAPRVASKRDANIYICISSSHIPGSRIIMVLCNPFRWSWRPENQRQWPPQNFLAYN